MRILAPALALLFIGEGSAAQSSSKACMMSAQELSWLEESLRASDYMMEERLRLAPVPHPTMIVFNERCRFELRKGSKRWVGEPHSGKVRLLEKGAMDVGLIAMQDEDSAGDPYFVIALPSIWRAAKVIGTEETGPTPVFLHEFSHARHTLSLRALFDAAAKQYEPPDYFNDDSLQHHFKSDPAYVAVVEKESRLLYEAAAEPDPVEARKLAAEALKLMEARQERWFVGTDAMWKPYDDLFLTMEGFGQWVAYAWLADPKGAGMTADAAREKMRGKRRWWSQEEGLGLFLVIDRFVPTWAEQAFGPEPKLGIDLLRQAVAGPVGGARPPRPCGFAACAHADPETAS